MSAHSNQPLPLDEALARICAQMGPTGASDTVELGQSLGRVLADSVSAAVALPPFDASAMDGYAVAAAPDTDIRGQTFDVIGESAAGHPCVESVTGNSCVRIFTGAPVPPGCQRVVLQEDCERRGEQILISGSPDPRTNIRPLGDDLPAGAPLDEPGALIDAVRIGRYAAAGVHRLSVHPEPTVGVFATGDELVEPSTPTDELPPGAIYESNRHALIALLDALPVRVQDLGCLRDDPAAVRAALRTASETCDVIITSGGVSVGDYDVVRQEVEALGTLDFWRLNLKPGKPLAFGQIDGCWFFGLPGNPVSTLVTWLLIAKPAVMNLCGAPPASPPRLHATLGAPLAHSPGRAEYQRGRFAVSGDQIEVVVNGAHGSNRLSTFDGANCLIELHERTGNLEAGQTVPIIPLSWL